MRKLLLLAMLLTVGLQASAQETGWGLHKRMFAVPTPGKVAVDGKLGDWDMSGALTVYVMAATKDVQSGRIAVMYDDQALYLGAEVRDPTPMMNRHAPEAEGDSAWDADSFQFRLVLDPAIGYPVAAYNWEQTKNDQLVHLLLWYYTDRKEPNLQIVSGMNGALLPGAGKFGVMPKNSFQAVYLLSDDKRSYTFEYRIPWSTLSAKKPLKGGDLVAGTMQFNWGRADGLKTAGYSAWGYDLMAFPGFPYQNAGCWGKLIFSKTGNLPKDLVEEGLPPEKPLPLTFDYEMPEEGQVSLVFLNDKNEAVRTLAAQAPRPAGKIQEKWDGLDSLDQPLPAGTYTWKGLYHGPITTQYVLSVHNSGQPAWKTDANDGGWGGDHGSPSSICTAGNNLVLGWNSAEAGWGIIRTDVEGKKQWGILRSVNFLATDGARIFSGEGTEVRCYDLKDGRPLPYGNGAAFLPLPPGGDEKTGAVTGLAYQDGKVFVSFAALNVIGVYDAKAGGMVAKWDVPSPGSLAARAADIVAISAGKVVAVKDGKIAPLIADHIDAPFGVAVDAAGQIYVSNRGKLQNISVFSADGKYLRSIGKEGGRPVIGRFDPAGMLEPSALAIDAKGRLWVMECIDSPKRVSVWDTKAGTLAKEFFGDAHYSAFIWMDPERPDEVYCDGALWKVDLDKKTSYPFSTAWRQRDPNSPASFQTHGGGLVLFTAKNGRQYGHATDGNYSRFLFIREGDVFKPLVAFIYTSKYPAAEKAFADPQIVAKYPWGVTFAWADANGDGLIQPQEMGKDLGTSSYRGFSSVDRDLNIWHGSGQVFRPLRIEADGRPVYDFTKPQTVQFPSSVAYADDDSVYTFSDNPQEGPKRINFARFRPDGTMLWGYRGSVAWPQALNLPPQQAGKFWGQTAFLGTTADYCGFATYFGTHHIYTRDGICVAMIFRDPRFGGTLGPDIISCENYNGQLVKPKGMNRYFALGGDQDGRISEVFGLETVKRLAGGTMTITEADGKKAAAAYAEYQAKLARAQRLVVVRTRKALDVAQPVSKTVNSGQSFQARAAYDEKNLYVMYDVTSPAELVSGITDPQLVFRGGNVLDIQLAADPKADPKRKTPVPGDVRILVTRQNGKPIAVIYRPKVKGFQGKPIVFRTANVESFDSIEVNEQIALEYQKLTSGTFRAVATIPLAVVGWQPQPGTKVKMDLGYIFGNNEGTKAMVRSYWANNGFSANVLNDVPNESKVEPAEWGDAEVELSSTSGEAPK